MNLLDVIEPTEPDNILWENTEVGDFQRRRLQFVASALACGIIIVCFYIMQTVTHPMLLAMIVGMIDISLPFVFFVLVFLERPADMDDLHDSVLVRR